MYLSLKSESVDGFSMQLYVAVEESGHGEIQKIAIDVMTVLDQMDSSVEAISLSGELGSVISV
jgi:hypothetical protein